MEQDSDCENLTWEPARGATFFFFNYLFICLWLCWVFVSVRGLSLVAASGGHSSSRCAGLSLSRPLLLRSTGSRRAGSVIVAHGPSRSAACGIFADQGANPCPLRWQADSQPPRHQGSPGAIMCCLLNTGVCTGDINKRSWNSSFLKSISEEMSKCNSIFYILWCHLHIYCIHICI